MTPLPFVEHAPVTLAVHDLLVRRGGRLVVAGASFAARPGTALALRGPNGAGKSSLLLALAGLIAIEGGTLDWALPDPERGAREYLHFLGHLPAVKSALTVAENLRFAAALAGAPDASVDAALDAVGLGPLARLDAGILSAGQTRRLGLARLLVAPRPVWLLDEPTSALDDEGAALVSAMIAGHLDAGGVVVLATHLALAIEADPRVHRFDVVPLAEPAL